MENLQFVNVDQGCGRTPNVDYAVRPTRHLAGLATKQDGSEPVFTLHYCTEWRPSHVHSRFPHINSLTKRLPAYMRSTLELPRITHQPLAAMHITNQHEHSMLIIHFSRRTHGGSTLRSENSSHRYFIVSDSHHSCVLSMYVNGG
jgi:hypothetical protein